MSKCPSAARALILALALLAPACDADSTGLSSRANTGLDAAGPASGDRTPAPAHPAPAPPDAATPAPADAAAPADAVLVPVPADAGVATPDLPEPADVLVLEPEAALPPDAAVPPPPDAALAPDVAPDLAADLAPDLAPDTAPVVPNHYEVKVGASSVPADGYSYIPVVVVGTRPDGSPATDSVTLTLSRAGGGRLEPATLTLTATGGRAFFVPCSHADSGCLGTVQVQVELTQAPGAVVARSADVTLVTPTGVGSPAACLIGPNVVFVEGNDSIFNGVKTVTDGTFMPSHATRSSMTIVARSADKPQDVWWFLQFGTNEPGKELTEQVYRNARRFPHQSPDHVGLNVYDETGSCDTVTGEFQVHAVRWSGITVLEFLATFVQYCNGSSSWLRGCVHYTAP